MPRASLLIWIAYFLVPTDAGGPVHGLPLGPLEIVALLMLVWLAALGRRIPGSAVAATVLIGATICAAAIPGTSGLRARYFANAAAAGAHERSTEFRDERFTRIDDRLDFGPGGPEFPLAFFNDSARFNFYQADEPHRARLEFAAAWTGQWWTEGGDHTLYLESPGASAELFVDGIRVATATPATGGDTKGLPLTPGWHRLDVSFSSPYAGPRRFSAGELINGQPRPFAAESVMSQRVRDWQMQAASALRRIKTAGDFAAIAWVAWLFASACWQHLRRFPHRRSAGEWRQWAAPILAIVAAVEALIFAWPWSRQLMVMRGGDDPMTYEWYSRDILLNGILMNFGAPLGQGEPFYYQAFYPYFLAAVHAITGEGMFGVMLVQRLLAAFAVSKLVEIAIELGSEAVWWVALAAATAFVAWKLWPIGAQPLNESLYVPMLVAWTAATVRLCRQPTTGRALQTGLLAGLTAITRSTVLLAWVVAWPACWVSWPAGSIRRRLLITMAMAALSIFSLITIRNAIVAHKFAPTSTELGITLLGGNEIPPGVTIDLARRQAIYTRLGIGDLTAQVIEYAITAPAAFAANLGRKALFALGFYEPYAPGWGYSPVYIVVWASALAGIWLAVRANPGGVAWSLLPAIIAMTQFVAVVVVYPKGERLILPIHVLLVPYSAVAFHWALAAIRGRAGR